MSNLISLPIEPDLANLVWHIIANDFDRPADQVQLQPWQTTVIIRYLRDHSQLMFDQLRHDSI